MMTSLTSHYYYYYVVSQKILEDFDEQTKFDQRNTSYLFTDGSNTCLWMKPILSCLKTNERGGCLVGRLSRRKIHKTREMSVSFVYWLTIRDTFSTK